MGLTEERARPQIEMAPARFSTTSQYEVTTAMAQMGMAEVCLQMNESHIRSDVDYYVLMAMPQNPLRSRNLSSHMVIGRESPQSNLQLDPTIE
jgi:hypothetical protein